GGLAGPAQGDRGEDAIAVADAALAGGLRAWVDRQRARRDRQGDAARQRLQLLPLVAEEGAAGVRILAKLGTVRVAIAALRTLDHGLPLRVLRRASTEGIALTTGIRFGQLSC